MTFFFCDAAQAQQQQARPGSTQNVYSSYGEPTPSPIAAYGSPQPPPPSAGAAGSSSVLSRIAKAATTSPTPAQTAWSQPHLRQVKKIFAQV